MTFNIFLKKLKLIPWKCLGENVRDLTKIVLLELNLIALHELLNKVIPDGNVFFSVMVDGIFCAIPDLLSRKIRVVSLIASHQTSSKILFSQITRDAETYSASAENCAMVFCFLNANEKAHEPRENALGEPRATTAIQLSLELLLLKEIMPRSFGGGRGLFWFRLLLSLSLDIIYCIASSLLSVFCCQQTHRNQLTRLQRPVVV